jgi:ectoine hydroxylase-related dioxygenase (phytanoyl-CoA dioxygenase family)
MLAQALAETGLSPTSHGHAFDTRPERFGELRDSSGIAGDMAALRERMAEDGYLLLRGYLDREAVLRARAELCERLAGVGLIDRGRPLTEAIFSGTTAQATGIDRARFAKELRTGPAVRAVCHSARMLGFYERFLGGEPLSYRYIWVRNVRKGAATGVHFDWVYMGRGTRNLYTSWTPMGAVPLADGPLAVLEGSHRIEELHGSYGALDVDRDDAWKQENHPYKGGWLTKDVAATQERFGRRWLTAEFAPGDLLLFGMFTLHCSLDNQSPENRIRLSVDSRYQLASEPTDERWVGEEPFGHGMM